MNHSKDPRPLKRSERILAKKKKRKRHLYALVILSSYWWHVFWGPVGFGFNRETFLHPNLKQTLPLLLLQWTLN